MDERAVTLFEHGLKDMYDAEQRFAQGLETMIEQTTDRALVDGFERHLAVTRRHARRLEQVFDIVGTPPQREQCAGAQGLVNEYESFVRKEEPKGNEHDLFAAGAALKVEHYEIAGYRALVDLASRLDEDDAVDLLKDNLHEEERTAADFEAAVHKLGAQLTGVEEDGAVSRAAGAVRERAKEGALIAAGVADRVRERAGEAFDEVEERGRKLVQARGRAATGSRGGRARTARKTTSATARKTTSATARKTTSATARRKVGARASRRVSARGRSTATKGRSRSTVRTRPAARGRARTASTSARRTSSGRPRTRSAAGTRRRSTRRSAATARRGR